jgi:ATP-dependent Clp protease adaptor protein ClpS
MIDEPLTITKPKIEFLVAEELEPPYRVLIHNDDVTPMDFVVMILESIFELLFERAEAVMYSAHIHGVAYVGTYPKDQASSRIQSAHTRARANSYPLKFTMEPEPG